MLKEPYLKPEIKSEVLEPGALATVGSPPGGGDDNGGGGGPVDILMPFFGLCCD